MISFSSDYIEGCAPEILKRFAETNLADVAIMPGDEVFATGTPMKGGRILLLMRK